MSEKRFFVKKIEDDFCILDSFDYNNVVIYCDSERVIQECCDLLNEQQAIIRRDEMSIKTMMSNMEKLEEENEQLQRENNLLNNNEDDLKECTLENIQLKEENQELKRLIKKMGELGGFNKHLIKTICED